MEGPSKKSKSSNFLHELFEGSVSNEWADALVPVLSKIANVEKFLGSGRDAHIVPVREMTFQALKSTTPRDVRVVIFGQSPYPRVESATGIAMFDADLSSWDSSRFGSIVSMRCIVKAAAMSKFGVSGTTDVAALRKLLRDKKIVSPHELFSSLLAQGVLLLNACLTLSTDDAITLKDHTAFWQPVVEHIVRTILCARRKGDPGVVFAWWGTKAAALRKMVEREVAKFPQVRVEHCVSANPAAQGDAFCKGANVFDAINKAVLGVGHKDAVDWLPVVGQAKTNANMTKFVKDTLELHKAFLERMDVKNEPTIMLAPIRLAHVKPPESIVEACVGIDVIADLEACALEAEQCALEMDTTVLTIPEIAAINLYTQPGEFYRTLNNFLRMSDRSFIESFFPYLSILLRALDKLIKHKKSKKASSKLYRGVSGIDTKYKVGDEIVWWGVSSCTISRDVAEGFLSNAGPRVLFVISAGAASVSEFSAMPEEEEFILPPGTKLKVTKVTTSKDKLTTVNLEEVVGERFVVYE